HPRGTGHAGKTASTSTGLHRRTGGAVRLLPERRDPDGKSLPRSESEGRRRRRPPGAFGCVVPLLHAHADAPGDREVQIQRGLPRRRGACAMRRDALDALRTAGFSRRDFLKSSGAIIVTFSGAVTLHGIADLSQGEFGTRGGHVDPSKLDSWIAI